MSLIQSRAFQPMLKKAGLQGADDMMHHLAITLRTLESLSARVRRWTVLTGFRLGAGVFPQLCIALFLYRIQELPQLN